MIQSCRHGIEVIGFSSDGDPRLLGAMKNQVHFDMYPDIDRIKRFDKRPICVQDSIHIGTKLRNRILNSSMLLQIGNGVASVYHIKILLHTLPKKVHGLVLSDIYPEDRQNFKSLVKIMDSRVTEALQSHVVDSNATVMYLTLCHQATSSFIDENLQPLERVYRIWHALYFTRCWRKWVQMSKGVTLSNNFISSNAYCCIEINAHALIDLIVKLRSKQHQNMFLPSYFASQPCESTFRKMRSLGTCNYTKINFTFNELLHMIARVEFMNRIAYSYEEIVSPRIQSKVQANASIILPSDEEIMNTMIIARRDALERASGFGMNFNVSDIMTCEANLKNESFVDDMENFDDEDEFEINVQQEEENKNTAESNSYVEVIDANGSTEIVPKSTLVWMLSDSIEKLSSDRQKRVQTRAEGSSSSSHNKKLKPNNLFDDHKKLHRLDELKIGDWAVFIAHESEPHTEQSVEQQAEQTLLLGIVLGFRYINDKKRIIRCKSDYVSTTASPTEKLTIESLIMPYSSDENGVLRYIPSYNQCFAQIAIDMKNYVANINTPTAKKDEASKNLSYELPYKYSELASEVKELTSIPHSSH